MDREQAKAEIKSRYADYLRPAKKKGTYICEIDGCGNGTGSTGDGLCIIPKSKGGDGTQLHCFKCGFTGDIIDYYQAENHCDTKEAFKALYERFNIIVDTNDHKPSKSASKGQETRKKMDEPKKEEVEQPQIDNTEYYRHCQLYVNEIEAAEYLHSREISRETVLKYFIGYDKEKKRIIIPVSKGFYLARDITGKSPIKYENPKGAPVGIFNTKALYGGSQYVFVTEGAFDALSLIEAGAEALALNSTSNTNLLLKAIDEMPVKKTLLLCLDNDNAGRTAQEKLKKELEERHIEYKECEDLVQPYKDANEALVADKDKLRGIIASYLATASRPDNAASYIKNKLAADIAEFKKGAQRSTGFSELDSYSGGIYSGLYVIGGISSVGKTTFVHQLADQLASKGNHVLFFSLEQSRLEMISKSLSRETASAGDPKQAATSLQIRKGKTNEAIESAKDKYIETIAENMSIIEGNFNCNASYVREYTARYIERNNTRPVVIIDYLQIMQPDIDPETGRKPTDPRIIADHNVTALKRITRDLDVPLFVISSVNRSNYLTEIDFESFKESGGIEYTADVVWGLQLQAIHDEIFSQANKLNEKRQTIKSAKAAIPRKIELVCLKNRYGEPNYAVNFNYKPQYDYFEEEPIVSPWDEQPAGAIRY